MFEIVQSPGETTSKGIRLFIAGGISNCPQWQNELIERLQNDERIKEENYEEGEEPVNIIIFNPRCKEIPEEKPQVTWEFNKLKSSDIISFWFSEGSMNPITLFEYGRYLDSKKKIIVGCHPDYPRKSNVIIQTELENPKITINENFEDFYNELVKVLVTRIISYKIRNFNRSFNKNM